MKALGLCGILSLVVSLSACGGVVPVAESMVQFPGKLVAGTVGFFDSIFSRPELRVEAIEVGRAQICNSAGRESALTVFGNIADVRSWEAQRGVSLIASEGDLPTGLYVLLEMGERNTGGYSAVVSRQAAVKDDELFLKATYLSPKTAGMAAQIISSPCSLVVVPVRNYQNVHVIDQANRRRASISIALTTPAPIVAESSPPAAVAPESAAAPIISPAQ